MSYFRNNSINFNGDIMNIIWKKMLHSLGIIFLLLIIFSLIINVLYYFDVISNNSIKFFKMVSSLLSFFIGGFMMGRNAPNKGYLYGIRLSLLVILVMFILEIILNNFTLSRIIYYLIILCIITFASMLGIQKRN